MKLQKISEHLYVFEDTCNVYALTSGKGTAVLVDFGSGDVLEVLAESGILWVSDVLMTHHHRDQGQGLSQAAAGGTRVWAPYNEQDLFHSVGEHWQARELFVNYNMRQDRFSLLEPVAVGGLLEDYASYKIGGYTFQVVPTPGHTTGSVTLMTEVDGQKVAFSGDLIYAPGKIWSLAATQWTYNGGEGLPAMAASLLDLKDRQPDVLLPSHGAAIPQPAAAIDLTVKRLAELMKYRQQNPHLFKFIESPYSAITPHLLRSNQNEANSYVLLSASGKALFIDFGYDFMTGAAAGSDRAAHRPWLYSLKGLKKQFGVTQVEVVVPTHYHDDHVAGINLLRRVEGAQAWVAQNFAPILASPARYNLPCLWYDPITADRVLPLRQPVRWQEYTLTLYPQPGHTPYAVAIQFEVDGKRVLAVGDQYQDEEGKLWNYVYQNRFRAGDYRLTASLYQELKPDLILPGHAEPLWVKPGYFEELRRNGEALERIHADLLPQETAGFGVEGTGARIEPYQTAAYGGDEIAFEVYLANPFQTGSEADVRLLAPPGWKVEPAVRVVKMQPGEEVVKVFHVHVPSGTVVRRARLTADVIVNGRRFGQLAEALVSVEEDERGIGLKKNG